MLTTEEIQSADTMWIKSVQNSQELKCDIELKQDATGFWRCAGRIPNYHPAFIPRNHKFVRLLIDHYHRKLLHGEYNFSCNFYLSQMPQQLKASCDLLFPGTGESQTCILALLFLYSLSSLKK